jgi:DNA mismatch repair protein MutL
VNVHPQKLEVRFSDSRSVVEAITAAITRALRAAPWRQNPGQPAGDELNAHYAQAVDRFLARAQETPGFALMPGAEPQPMVNDLPGGAGFGTARPGINETPPPGYFSSLRFLGELGKRFWICEGPGGSLIVIDPRAVRERVTLESLRERHQSGALREAGPSLFSTTVSTPVAKDLLGARERLLEVGVELEDFGPDTLAVKRVPQELEQTDVAGWLPVVAEAPDAEAMLIELAFAAASGPLRAVGHDEARALLAQLDDVDFDVPCRRETVVVSELPLLDLEAKASAG